MIKYKGIRKHINPYTMGLSSPYKQNTNHYNKQNKYMSRRSGGGGGSGGYKAKSPYTLKHNFHHQPENYKAKPEPRSSQPLIIHKTESNQDRPQRIEVNDDSEIEDRIKRLENSLGGRVNEILEQLFPESTENIDDIKKKLEADLESDRIRIENSDSESDPVPIENSKDDTGTESDEIPPTTEVNQEDDVSELVESINKTLEIPPEEAEYNPEFAEIAEEVLENPVLADEIAPEIWSEIEVLVEDLEAELEPEIEEVEPGYY